MSVPTILLLLIFVIISGLIAYFGDLLGRRMGKRRLTIFGLRPRYTAVFMTIATGMIIAAGTIAVMAITSENVRILLTKGDNIISRMKTLNAQYNKINKSYNIAVENLDKQRKITQKASDEANIARKSSQRLKDNVEKISKSLAILKSNLVKNQAALKDAENNLRNSNVDLEKAKKEIASRRHEIDFQQNEIDRLNRLKDQLAIRLDKEALPRLIALRERRIIFHPAEEIYRKVISSNQSKSLISEDIKELLNDANRVSIEKGAAIGENGFSIQLLPKSIEGSDGNIKFLEDKETINAIVENISNTKGTVVLLLVSVGNSLEGEQALVEFSPPFRNNLIYSKDDEIASVIIDGKKTRGAILEDIISFLRIKVRSEAMNKGLIPQFDSDGQPVVGQIDDWDVIFDLIDKIKVKENDVRVNAHALSNTWSSGPLQLYFTVSE